MASEVSIAGVSLSSAVPEELAGPIEVAFHLPGDLDVIRCRARVEETEAKREDTEARELRREVRFLDLSETLRTKIKEYVLARQGRFHA
jgi:hypothetical protein